MARKVRFTKKASTKFKNNLIHLEINFGDIVARRFLKRTYAFFDILVDFPHIGIVEDRKKGIYGFVVEKPITIFYRYNDHEIIILNFFDNRMNPKKKY